MHLHRLVSRNQTRVLSIPHQVGNLVRTIENGAPTATLVTIRRLKCSFMAAQSRGAAEEAFESAFRTLNRMEQLLRGEK